MANITMKGIKLFPKKDNQPDFVIASGVINPDDLNAFLIDNKEHSGVYNNSTQFRIQVLKGKDGGPYIVLDTYKAQAAAPVAPLDAKPPVIQPVDDLPF